MKALAILKLVTKPKSPEEIERFLQARHGTGRMYAGAGHARPDAPDQPQRQALPEPPRKE